MDAETLLGVDSERILAYQRGRHAPRDTLASGSVDTNLSDEATQGIVHVD